jgi:ankyrin repeat protein
MTIHYASRKGDCGKVAQYIALGADPDGRDLNGWTPLHYAGYCGCIDVFQLLLQHVKDVNAITYVHKETVLTLILRANSRTKRHQLFYMLLFGGGHVDVNLQNISGKTALHLAIRKGDWEIVQQLLLQGANYNLKTNSGWSPLHYTIFYHH